MAMFVIEKSNGGYWRTRFNIRFMGWALTGVLVIMVTYHFRSKIANGFKYHLFLISIIAIVFLIFRFLIKAFLFLNFNI